MTSLRFRSPSRSWRVVAFIVFAAGLTACDALDEYQENALLAGQAKDRAMQTPEEARAESEERLKRQTLESVSEHRYSEALSRYEALTADGIGSEAFTQELKEAVQQRRSVLSDAAIDKRIEANKLLSQIDPDNPAYLEEIEAITKPIRERANKARAELRSEYDKVEGITWYYPKIDMLKAPTYFYIGTKKGRGPWLRFNVVWRSSNWLFVESVTAWFDGERVTLESGNFERRSGYTAQEWKDVSATGHHTSIMRQIANSEEAILRFTGDRGIRDITITAAQKRAILTVLDAFYALEDEALLDEALLDEAKTD